MSRAEKLITRFLSRPKDFTWDELVSLLNHFEYTELQTGKTGGSRRKFADKANNLIILHKPHPKPIVKLYVIDQVLNHLQVKGKIV